MWHEDLCKSGHVAAARRAFVVALALAPPAGAEPARELEGDVSVDVGVTVAAAVVAVGTELAKPSLAPRACRVCDRGPNGGEGAPRIDLAAKVNLAWSHPHRAAYASDLGGFVLAPVNALGTLAIAGRHDDAGARTSVDALFVLESVALAAATNQIVKLAVGRERPFVHDLPAEAKRTTSQPADNNLSFYSGHTSLTFSLATAAGTVASLRGYRLAPLVWATGLPIAAATGYLRIAAGKHYLSDVVVGAVVGAAFGTLVPLLFHGRTGEAVTGPLPAAEAPLTVSLGAGF